MRIKKKEDFYYDYFLKIYRSVRYYEKYLKRLKQVEGCYIHTPEGKCIKVKSLFNLQS